MASWQRITHIQAPPLSFIQVVGSVFIGQIPSLWRPETELNKYCRFHRTGSGTGSGTDPEVADGETVNTGTSETRTRTSPSGSGSGLGSQPTCSSD